MESRLAMRLRTLIELLAALILTFAALVAISKMARATGMKVENTFARATIGEAKTGAVYMTLNNVGSEPDRLRSVATHAARRAVEIDPPYSDARREPLADLGEYSELRRQISTSSV